MRNLDSTRSTALLGLVVVAVAGLVIGSAYTGMNDEPTDPSPATGNAIVVAEHPLDEIPGFGKGDEARLRDDAVALWEAYQRETQMTTCMRQAGFEYHADLRAAGIDFQNTAAFIGLTSDAKRISDSEGRNDKIKLALNKEALNKYYLTLYGVSWDDISDEKGDVTKEGCFADALTDVPSVFAPRERLSDALLELNEAVSASPSMQLAEGTYEACAAKFDVKARNQGDVESSGTTPENVDAVIAACGPAYDVAKAQELARHESDFLNAHPELLDHANRYENARAEMASDQGFLDALGAG